MGSDRHYPEEAPARPVTVDGFWIDRAPVTNAQFEAFVTATGHQTAAERPADANAYPGADPALLAPASAVFTPPSHPVDLGDPYQWWSHVLGADWRHPAGPRTSLYGLGDHPVTHVAWVDVVAYAAWAGKEIPTEAEWEYAAPAAGQAENSRGATSSTRAAGIWRTPGRATSPTRTWNWTATLGPLRRCVPGERLRPVRHDRQCVGVDVRLVHRPGIRRSQHADVLRHAWPPGPPGRRHRVGQLRTRPGASVYPAQGDEGRLAPVCAELLPPLPSRRPSVPTDRHLDLPPRFSLHRPPIRVAAGADDNPARDSSSATSASQPALCRQLVVPASRPDVLLLCSSIAKRSHSP